MFHLKLIGWGVANAKGQVPYPDKQKFYKLICSESIAIMYLALCI